MSQANKPEKFVIAVDPDRRRRRGLDARRLRDRQFRRRASWPSRGHRAHPAARRRTRRAERGADLRAASGRFLRRRAGRFSSDAASRQSARARRIRPRRRGHSDLRRRLAALSAEEFVREVLVERLGVAAVVIGWDFHFGKGRAGSPAFLQEAGARHGFRVDIIDKIEALEGRTTRADFLDGDPPRAGGRRRRSGRALVGPRLCGGRRRSIPGRKLGRTLGVPTANIALEPSNRLAHGVYAVEVFVDGARFGGVASFGTRPTVDDGPPLLGDVPVRFRRRPLWPNDRSGIRQAHSRRSRNSTASTRWSPKWSATRRRRGRSWPGGRTEASVAAGVRPPPFKLAGTGRRRRAAWNRKMSFGAGRQIL